MLGIAFLQLIWILCSLLSLCGDQLKKDVLFNVADYIGRMTQLLGKRINQQVPSFIKKDQHIEKMIKLTLVINH